MNNALISFDILAYLKLCTPPTPIHITAGGNVTPCSILSFKRLAQKVKAFRKITFCIFNGRNGDVHICGTGPFIFQFYLVNVARFCLGRI